MQITLCAVGVGLLTGAMVLCWFAHDYPALWLGMLLVGEIVAWSGAIPILSNFPR